MVLLALVGCRGEFVATGGEVCDVEPAAIAMPAECWEDAERCPLEGEPVVCGRAYMCPGEGYETCVTVQDCDCLDEVVETCDLEVEHPAHCR